MRVLIIRPGALGDTLMLLPALADLAGKAVVTFAGRGPGLEFIRPCVDRAMDLEGSGWHRLFMDLPDGKGLPVSSMEIVAAFLGDEDGMIRRNLNRFLPGAAVHIFPSFPPRGENIHVAEHLARCLQYGGLPVHPDRVMAAAREGSNCGRRRLPKGKQRIVLHPGSGSAEKNHPPAFWHDLDTRFGRDPLFEKFIRVLLLGPAEDPLHGFFTAQPGMRDTEICRSRDSDRLREILDTAALYVGHDSGVTHLAALRCVPTVALFKGSDLIQWAPLGPFVRVIENHPPGQALLKTILDAARELVESNGGSLPEE